MSDSNVQPFAKSFEEELNKKINSDEDYHRLGLNFNPFSPAGIPKEQGLDKLEPLSQSVKKRLRDFVVATYGSSEYSGLTIVGDFGSGKTHTMLYLRKVLEGLSTDTPPKPPVFVCYVDRPEEAPSKVINRLVENIGLDNLRKYVWTVLIDNMSENKATFSQDFRLNQTNLMGENSWDKLFSEPTKSNPQTFISEFKKLKGDLDKLRARSKDVLVKKLVYNEALVNRYLDLLFEDDKHSDKSWEVLAGYSSSRDLKDKEVHFLNSLVKLLRINGFKMVYVFIDEFEDVDKLRSSKFSDYMLTLNTMINSERNWAVVVSITEDALSKVREYSTPLYDRLTSWEAKLQPLGIDEAKILVQNYVSSASSENGGDGQLFSEELFSKILAESTGNYRSFVRIAYKVVEHARAKGYSFPLPETVLGELSE